MAQNVLKLECCYVTCLAGAAGLRAGLLRNKHAQNASNTPSGVRQAPSWCVTAARQLVCHLRTDTRTAAQGAGARGAWRAQRILQCKATLQPPGGALGAHALHCHRVRLVIAGLALRVRGECDTRCSRQARHTRNRQEVCVQSVQTPSDGRVFSGSTCSGGSGAQAVAAARARWGCRPHVEVAACCSAQYPADRDSSAQQMQLWVRAVTPYSRRGGSCRKAQCRHAASSSLLLP
jgi:hypothetical protein